MDMGKLIKEKRNDIVRLSELHGARNVRVSVRLSEVRPGRKAISIFPWTWNMAGPCWILADFWLTLNGFSDARWTS